jgi:AraC family transcriptional regulator of adaptative response/methylated-DNA-[protein]-cysteine methyltransferase
MTIPQPLDPARWRAVASRDARADGTFFYAVTTTGIFCRPSCPSRRPRPEHVRLFETPAAAAQAGFRPCRRCRPERTASLHDDRRTRILAACHALDRSPPPTLAALASETGLSRFHFQREFKRVVGVTPGEYRAARRRTRLQGALGGGEAIDAALYDAGFGSPSRVYERTGLLLGMSPGVYRKGAPGMRIRCGAARTSLGWLAVAATDRGVCAIELGGSRATLETRIHSRFPKARFVRADGDLDRWLAAAVAFVEAPARGLDLPLDVRGTAFQQRVWQALQAIPRGATLSYGELARHLGKPRGARAVARAVASNPVALAIPCHRVVAAGGALAGYRWGIDRKRQLLARERDVSAASRARRSARPRSDPRRGRTPPSPARA